MKLPQWSQLSWRLRRQLMYLAIPIIPTLMLGSYLIFQHYTTASCSDGKINQGEQGVDCEGPCEKICQARIVDLEVMWANAFTTVPGTYNLAGLIENKNKDLAANDVAIEFEVYSEDKDLLYIDEVSVDLLPATSIVAFKGPIELDRVPAEVIIRIPDSIAWQQYDSELYLVADNKMITGSKTSPRVEVEMSNESRDDLRDIPVSVLVKNESDIPVAVSQTLVSIEGQSSASITYTWPRAFPTTSGVCQQPVNVMVAMDASGSMNSISIDPPEPLTSVKNAARRFAGLFSGSDKLGIAMFANNAAVVQEPTTSLEARLKGIDQIIITKEAEEGYTNIADALVQSLLSLERLASQNRGQAIVLLTDGEPTAPDNASDPELAAMAAAAKINEAGIELFAIGLGEASNEGFLQNLVGGDRTKVFQTSNPAELSTIYSQIASAVCERQPYLIEVYPAIPL